MEEAAINQLQAIQPTQTAITPDGTFVQALGKQTFIVDIFFNHNTKDTFEDKFLRVILAEERKLQLQKGGI